MSPYGSDIALARLAHALEALLGVNQTAQFVLHSRAVGRKGESLLQVLLTIDTEFWPSTPRQWPARLLPRPLTAFEADYAQDILGQTATGNYGLPYLLDSLSHHQLNAVFFVESLHASALGGKLLERTVRALRAADQDIQLHVHTEWLAEVMSLDLPSPYRQNLGDFNRADQTHIVREALGNLRAAGGPSVVALRAGNLGGSADTVYAAKAAGLAWDMSFDLARARLAHHMIHDLAKRDDVAGACPSIPLSCVEDYPGHFRPAQLTALSFAELQHALFCAERERWPFFVIMLHSFELIKRGSSRPTRTRAHKINIRRWSQLCELLDRRRDIFRTITCQDLVLPGTNNSGAQVTRTLPMHTLLRIAEQLASRVL
jgi:hypothetical protein